MQVIQSKEPRLTALPTEQDASLDGVLGLSISDGSAELDSAELPEILREDIEITEAYARITDEYDRANAHKRSTS